jgi:hypothetical protein
VDFADKRYAAHMAAGQELLTKGNKGAAANEFEQANSIDPKRSEAKAASINNFPECHGSIRVGVRG